MIGKFGLYILASLLASFGVVYLRKIEIPNTITYFVKGFHLILFDRNLWIGLLLYGGAFLCFLIVVNKSEISSRLPQLIGTYLIVTIFVGVFFLGENLTLAKVAASALIILGVALL